jgi:hypothetical protein
MSELVTYQVFYKEKLLEKFCSLLSEKNIHFETRQMTSNLESYSEDSEIIYEVWVNQEDIPVIDQLVDEKQEGQDHYLFQFSDEDLLDIIINRHEWSLSDYKMAHEILKQRGKGISEELAATMRKHKSAEIVKTEEKQSGWIAAGYILALLGGVVSIFIGYHLAWGKKKLPGGEITWIYRKEDRFHGQVIFYLGISVSSLMIIINIIASSVYF